MLRNVLKTIAAIILLVVLANALLDPLLRHIFETGQVHQGARYVMKYLFVPCLIAFFFWRAGSKADAPPTRKVQTETTERGSERRSKRSWTAGITGRETYKKARPSNVIQDGGGFSGARSLIIALLIIGFLVAVAVIQKAVLEDQPTTSTTGTQFIERVV